MKIIRYNSYYDITVRFQDEYKFERDTTYSNFKKGNVRNPYDKTVLDMGYLGVGKYLTQDETKENSREYMCWKHMIERCYTEKHADIHRAYYGICTICDEWLNFQTFAEWYDKNKYECDGRLHLDKDIRYPGNKIYSQETCLLVPQRINMLFINKSNKRGLPNGISECPEGYLAKYNGKTIGIYSTVEDAYYEQTKKKKEEIIRVANEYKSIMPKEVYDAILAYEFKIENDKNYKVV